MFRELVRAYERFRDEGELPPTAYSPKSVSWIIELGGSRPSVGGPYKRTELLRRVNAPDRYRSGKQTSLPPFLLLDKADFVLGRVPSVKERFVRLIEQARDDATDQDLRQELADIILFLQGPMPPEAGSIDGNDLVGIRSNTTAFPFEHVEMRAFWMRHLATEFSSKRERACSICGKEKDVVRILPRPVVVFGQKCQIASFDDAAYRSFGRRQTENAPMCFECACRVIDVLDYLIKNDLHKTPILLKLDPAKRIDPFHSQLAVFWLTQPLTATDASRQPIDIDEAMLRTLLTDQPVEAGAPRPDIVQLEALVKLPWTGRAASLNLATESFCLAVLSANKGRLVVRDWFSVSIAELRERLAHFLDATRLVSFRGDEARPRSIAAILDALPGDPNLSTGLLRSAYLGHRPPPSLIGAAVPRLRVLWQKGRQDKPLLEAERIRHIEALTTAIKLSLAYREDEKMEALNSQQKSAPYLCGRVLAVLEEAQQRASGWSLNRTLVERFYGAASTAPSSVFGNLIRTATAAYFPEVNRDLNMLIEDVMRDLDEHGGFPATLTAAQQAEFALGFYHQRADFRSARQSHQQPQDPA